MGNDLEEIREAGSPYARMLPGPVNYAFPSRQNQY